MNKLIFLGLIPILTLSISNVYASGPEYDYDEKYENVPGAPECWYDGYADGKNNPFNHDRNDECDNEGMGNQYYRAFIHGCVASDNSKETCEDFTDQ